MQILKAQICTNILLLWSKSLNILSKINSSWEWLWAAGVCSSETHLIWWDWSWSHVRSFIIIITVYDIYRHTHTYYCISHERIFSDSRKSAVSQLNVKDAQLRHSLTLHYMNNKQLRMLCSATWSLWLHCLILIRLIFGCITALSASNTHHTCAAQEDEDTLWWSSGRLHEFLTEGFDSENGDGKRCKNRPHYAKFYKDNTTIWKCISRPFNIFLP